MIFEIYNHLQASPIKDYTFVYERDDTVTPFSTATSTPVVLRQQGGRADRDLTRATFDIHVFTQANALDSHKKTLFEDMGKLKNWLLQHYEYGRIGNIEVVGGVSGIYRDNQDRRFMTLSINVTRSSGG